MGSPDRELRQMGIVPNEDHPPMSQDRHPLKVKKTIKGVGGGKGKGAGKLKVRKKATARRTRAKNTIKGR